MGDAHPAVSVGSAHLDTGPHPRLQKSHSRETMCLCVLNSLSNRLDDLGGGVLDVGEEALGAPTQNVQEPAIRLLVLSDHQTCRQRQTCPEAQAPQQARPSAWASILHLCSMPRARMNWVEMNPGQSLAISAGQSLWAREAVPMSQTFTQLTPSACWTPAGTPPLNKHVGAQWG